MPLARAALYEKGVQIYVMPTADARDTWLDTVCHVAAEGRCFVLSCNQYSTKSMYSEAISARTEFASLPEELCRGDSCIAGPPGEWVKEPVYGKETIVYAELDLDKIAESQFDFDPVGHYARPDVFRLTVNEKKKENVKWETRKYCCRDYPRFTSHQIIE